MSNKRPINAVGVLFYSTSTNRVLYLLRNDREQCWGIPGGKIERGEVLREALKRECSEEISTWQDDFKLYPLECYTNGTFKYHTFFVAVDDEFVPRLNNSTVRIVGASGAHFLGRYTRVCSLLYSTLSFSKRFR